MLNYLILTQMWLRSFPEEMGQLRRRVRNVFSVNAYLHAKAKEGDLSAANVSTH